jgi:bifunctional UDP-N-acetylglucosamine pyrophosphorylase/glucosamine-1-phosphate N-acetyltransferase
MEQKASEPQIKALFEFAAGVGVVVVVARFCVARFAAILAPAMILSGRLSKSMAAQASLPRIAAIRLNLPDLSTRDSMAQRTTAVVLAAGEGTRMKSAIPKVLHRVAGQPLIAHVLRAARAIGADRIAVVVGPDRDDVAAEVKRAQRADIFIQRERKGTAHAVLAARDSIAKGENVVVVFGDTPLLKPETLRALKQALGHAAVVVLGFRAKNPKGYGRLLMEGGRLAAIREEKDANEAERAVNLCNAGVMALAGKHALSLLAAIGNRNAKQEFYLTDAVALAVERNLTTAVIEAPEEEVMGVNDRKQLAEAEATLQKRLRDAALEAGVTLVAPETVFLAADTKFGRDVTIEPNVVFGPGVTVGDNATIRSFSHIEGAQIGNGARVGPFARLRPGAKLSAEVHIGNFVEVKEALIGKGAKANHLAYIGDASVGENANIGAGTITCNYDGVHKHRTEIGKNAFIGTNSSLVAPVKVGAGAYIGSGSVIVDDVPADALALGRGKQVVKKGWAKKRKAGKTAKAKSKKRKAR